MAEGENQPVMHDRYPNFEWALGLPTMNGLDDEFEGIYSIVDIINNKDNIEEERQENQI